MKNRIKTSYSIERKIQETSKLSKSGLFITNDNTLQIPLVNQRFSEFKYFPDRHNEYGQEINSLNINYMVLYVPLAKISKNNIFEVIKIHSEFNNVFIVDLKSFNGEIKKEINLSKSLLDNTYFLTKEEYDDAIELLSINNYQKIESISGVSRITSEYSQKRKEKPEWKKTQSGLVITQKGVIQVPLIKKEYDRKSELLNYNFYNQEIIEENIKYLVSSLSYSIITKNKIFEVLSINKEDDNTYYLTLKDFNGKITENICSKYDLQKSYFMTKEEYIESIQLLKMNKEDVYNAF